MCPMLQPCECIAPAWRRHHASSLDSSPRWQKLSSSATFASQSSLLYRRLPQWIQRCSSRCRAVRRSSQPSVRSGFKVNAKYKGAASYGTVSDEEFEDARRIRQGFNAALNDASQKAEQRYKDARKRLAERHSTQKTPQAARLRRVKQTVSQARAPDARKASDDAEKDEEAPDAEEASEDESAEGLTEAPEEASAEEGTANAAKSVPIPTDFSLTREWAEAAIPVKTAPSSGTAKLGPPAWQGWPEPLALDAAKMLAEGQLKKPAKMLQAGARSLADAGEHALAARLLRELRDFGVQKEVLERRLSLTEGDKLVQKVSIYLGLELSRAKMKFEAWEALMALCAEPELRPENARPAVEALADVTAMLQKSGIQDAQKEVEILQGAVDAELVLKVLDANRRQGLEINLALALQRAGREQESRGLLKQLASTGLPNRRKEAEWALTVQEADIGDEPQEAVVAMKKIFSDEANQLEFHSTAAGAAAAAAAAAARSQARGRSTPLGMSNAQGLLLAALVLALPLALPALLSGQGGAR